MEVMKVMSSGNYIFIDWQTDRQNYRHKQTDTQNKDRQTDIHGHIDSQTDIYIRQTNRQTEKKDIKSTNNNNEYLGIRYCLEIFLSLQNLVVSDFNHSSYYNKMNVEIESADLGC